MVEHLLCALPGRPRFDDAHRAVRFHGRDLRPFEDLRRDAVGSVLDHQRDDAAGEAPNGENGGGALALPTGTDDREAKDAYTFAHSDGVKGNLAQEGIPPLKSTLGDPQYLAQTDDFFGGQKPHAVIAQASKDVRTDFTYLSYTAHANSIAVDSIGQSYHGKLTLHEALQQWGESLKKYGEE